MNPTVVAAAIGVGGTVVVGVAGFSAAIWNTRRTIAYARESRVWDKRAAAYEAAFAELVNRRARLRPLLSVDSHSPPEEMLAEYLASRDTPAWSAAETQLLAYASKEVLAAANKARAADADASMLFDKLGKVMKAYGQLIEDVGAERALREQYRPATEQAFSALFKSDERDSALIDLIRAELQGGRA